MNEEECKGLVDLSSDSGDEDQYNCGCFILECVCIFCMMDLYLGCVNVFLLEGIVGVIVIMIIEMFVEFYLWGGKGFKSKKKIEIN